LRSHRCDLSQSTLQPLFFLWGLNGWLRRWALSPLKFRKDALLAKFSLKIRPPALTSIKPPPPVTPVIMKKEVIPPVPMIAVPNLLVKQEDVLTMPPQLAKWDFEKRCAYINVGGTTHWSKRKPIQLTPPKGDGSPVGATFELDENKEIFRVVAVWWSLVNATPAKKIGGPMVRPYGDKKKLQDRSPNRLLNKLPPTTPRQTMLNSSCRVAHATMDNTSPQGHAFIRSPLCLHGNRVKFGTENE
jgi:hypothetical protein